MGGFINNAINNEIASDILNYIFLKVQHCFELMIQDCLKLCVKIDNNENRIRDYLFSKYLNNDEIMRKIDFDNFRFFAEVPENYSNNIPLGRTDLQVISIDDFRHRNRYFIIECKRLDGGATLNRKYIDDGIRRFVGEDPKYSSYYKTNGMIGFLVKTIDIDKNVEKINNLLKKDYTDITTKEYLCKETHSGIYISTHGLKNTDIKLKHLA